MLSTGTGQGGAINAIATQALAPIPVANGVFSDKEKADISGLSGEQ